MIADKLLYFSLAQADTGSAASTDIVDTLKLGNAYVAPWFVVQVDTAYTAGAGAPTNTFQLQTSDTSDFSGSGSATLAASAALLATQLVAGYEFAIRIPPGAKRYLRAYKVATESAGAFTAGKFDAFIVEDYRDPAKRLA